jgi:hypothetical protein
MINFTGVEYLMIDVCNAAGKDKMLFEDRIQWTKDNLTTLEQVGISLPKKEQPMFYKATMAIRDAQAGKPIGHLVGFDGVCSGIQMMSVLTGCYEGAKATGLVDPDRRADAYTQTTDEMRKDLGPGFDVSRADAKQALMTSFYGSTKVPKEVFGDDTPELMSFYRAAQTVAPGAWDLLAVLLASWNPNALAHVWKMPDGYDARVKVLVDKEARIEVDELDHSTFTYEYSVNETTPFGLSNAANVVHSVDAYVLRTVHRRCNYDADQISYADQCIQAELLERSMWGQPEQNTIDSFMDEKVAYYIEQYERSTVVDTAILSHLDQGNTTCLSAVHLKALAGIVTGMLEYKPFEVVTIHDEFRCHPNNMNHLRAQYRNILAELAGTEVLSDLLSQLYGTPYQYPKLTNDLGDHIMK